MRRRDIMKAGVVALVGCGPDKPPQDAPAAGVSAAPAPPVAGDAPPPLSPPAASAAASAPREAADPALLAALARWRVSHDDYARSVFYTWTKPDQIADLRRVRWLVTRRSSPSRFAVFDHVLLNHGEAGRLLFTPALRYRRFGWISPWATLRGWEQVVVAGGGYGDQLVRVELRPGAILGRLDSRQPGGWSFVDSSGGDVDEDTVHAAPHRLAAIYHVWHGDEEGNRTTPEQSYREYVLCNESMIARWEYGTEAVKSAIRDDIATATKLADWFDKHPPLLPESTAAWSHRVDREVWPHKPPDDPVALYEASLAFANDNYTPSAATLRQVVKMLERVLLAQGRPISHQPRVKFGDEPPIEKMKAKPKTICRGTMVSGDCVWR